MRAVVLLSLAALLAPLSLAAEPEGTTIPWNILDCEFVYGTVFVPATLIEAVMPQGFRPFVVSPALADTVAQVGFEANKCTSGSGLNGQVEPMLYASTWTPAIAPPGMSVPGVGMFVNWDVLVPDADRRAFLAASGTPAYDGDVAISTSLRVQPIAPFSVEYDFGGNDVRFDIVPGPGSGAVGGSGEFAQYTGFDADGDLTYWRTKWAVREGYQGVGVITLDPASWQAAVLGTTTLPARFSYGTWDYTDGKIVVAD